MEKKHLNEKETADYTGFSVHSLRKWRQDNKGIPFKKLETGSIRYSVEEIDAYMNRDTATV